MLSGKVLKMALYCAVFNLFLVPINEGIAALFGYLTIILLLLYPILVATNNNIFKIDKSMIILAFLIIISFFTSVNEIKVLTFEIFKKGIISSLSFISFYMSLSQNQQKNQGFYLEDIFKIGNVMCLSYMLYAFGPFSFKYTEVNKYGNLVFNMGLGNTNAVSVGVLFCIMIYILKIVTEKKIIIRGINIILTAILMYILFLLSSRTVFACALVALVAYFFSGKKIIKIAPYFTMFIPVAMVVAQYNLRYVNINYKIMGKAIDTGRSNMYYDALNEVSEFPMKYIFGDFCKYTFENMHNGVLSICMTLGIVGVLWYFMFWFKQIRMFNLICKSQVQNLAYSFILIFIIHSSAEAMVVIGTIPYSLFVLLIYKIAKGDIVSKYDRIAKS